jgi:hypothetical protein
MQLYAKREFMEKLNVALGDRFLGRSYTITNNYDIAVGVTNNDPGSKSLLVPISMMLTLNICFVFTREHHG